MDRWPICRVLLAGWIAGAIVAGPTTTLSAPAGNAPIHVTFVIHFDPLPAPGGRVPRWAYEAERDNLAWLADYLDRLEREKGMAFVPRLTLEIAGDHAEWYLEDEIGLELLRRLHRKGIHCFGTHFHKNFRQGSHVWVDAPSPESSGRVTHDHVAMVDRLIGAIIGSDDPTAIRAANRTITGHFVDLDAAAQAGFDTLTGGRNEALNLFFDHDVYNPWRPADGWPLAEDWASPWVLVPQGPDLGSIGEHCPLPPGVAEEYARGMRQIWQDLSVPAMKRKFLHLHLERRATGLSAPGDDRSPWVFGWHEHTNSLFPDNGSRRGRRLRAAVMEFVEWLNANFIGQGGADGKVIARYATTDEVRDAYLAWEKAGPRRSSFHYDARTCDWEKYPYRLKRLAWELVFSHHDREIDGFRAQGVHAHRLLKAPGRTWEMRGAQVVSAAPTKDIYLLWGNRGAATIDFSGIVAGPLRRAGGASGKETVADAKDLTVDEEPIIVEARENPTRDASSAARDAPMPIQFRMNVNHHPDENAARENCRLLRRHLGLFEHAGAKASYWFTGLAAQQVGRLDPEFLKLLDASGMPVAHHGANRPPNPQPIHRVRGENWEEDVRAIMEYESHAIDPATGLLDKDREGGLKKMQQMFGGHIRSTGRFFEASILQVAKQLGCEAMIGLGANTGASTEAGWFLGMKGMPDSLSIDPTAIRRAAAGQRDIFGLIEKTLATSPADGLSSIAVLVHDTDFAQRSPTPPREGSPVASADLGQRFWDTYEKLLRWAVAHPRLKVMTFEEILAGIADDRTKTVERDALLQAAAVVAGSPAAPPEYVGMDGDYLSLADAFQAFAAALAHFEKEGALPDNVVARDILGPTRYRPEERPTIGPSTSPITSRSEPVDIETPGAQIIAAAMLLDLSKEIPSRVGVGGKEVNPAVFLKLMAQTIQSIAASGDPGTVRVRGEVNVLPLQVQQNPLADALTKLQFWTFKPERAKRSPDRTADSAAQ